MNRNAESRFSINPTNIDIARSTFKRDSRHITSANCADIIPFYVDEVLPGDTHQIKTSKVFRLQTLITPVMDSLYLDTYYFFVPTRLVWSHWKAFNGENESSPWIPANTYTIPQITSPSGGWNVGTIADYMGIPTGIGNLSVSALPFRCYALIMNEYFRDENLSSPLNISFGDATVAGSNGGTFVTDVALGGLPYTAAKFHDYFSSALPLPQKGSPIEIGLAGSAPVFGTGNGLRFSDGTDYGYVTGNAWTSATPFYLSSGSDISIGSSRTPANMMSGILGVQPKMSSGIDSGLYTDLSGATAISINELRLAFQLQKMLEKDARGGSRYIEFLKVHFGVTSPDARLQRPEYLGGNRISFNVNQVVQNSATDSVSPQGNVAGYSVTGDSHGDFIKSFTEHGYIIGVCVARYPHTYQQGIERMWNRVTREDFYLPVFANIGEQVIKNKEIYAQGSSVVDSDGNVVDEQAFGFQEAWAEYRYKPSRVSGEMRSSYATSLDVWHFADDYSSLPYLSDTWIREDKTNVDRALAVQSSTSNQILIDFYIQNKTTRPMPLYSIPGLVDHH